MKVSKQHKQLVMIIEFVGYCQLNWFQRRILDFCFFWYDLFCDATVEGVWKVWNKK